MGSKSPHSESLEMLSGKSRFSRKQTPAMKSIFVFFGGFLHIKEAGLLNWIKIERRLFR